MKHAIYLSIIAILLSVSYVQHADLTAHKVLLRESGERITALETNKTELMGMLSRG
ncbi:hypothetical protein [Aeromonas veronii]|uniref:hypothetical protein n=1 Tax=Aeromonas veronii TaxID=654 RepID=UPI003D1DBA48